MHWDFSVFYVLFKYDTLNRSTGKTVNLVNPVDVSYSYYRSQKAYDESGTLIDATLSSSRLEKELIGERCYRMEYDELENIVKEEYGTRESAQSTVEFIQNVTYEYDARNQLIRENNQLTDQTITYEYDAYGNLLNKTYYAYTTGELKEAGERVVYTYQTEGWKDLLTVYDGEPITYDAIGNPLTYREAALSWEGRELKSYAKDTIAIEYETDYSGKRVQKTVNGVEYSYVYTGDLLTYEAGEIVAQYSYDAWGNTITVTDRDGNRITDPEHMGNLNLIRYRGYYYDAETGLYYLNSRYYDPEVGRFISADDTAVLSVDQGSLLQYNLFAYCLNNPVNRIDESGYLSISILAKGASLVATGLAAIGVAAAVVTCGVATPIMLGVAAITMGAGALTTINGVSDIGEAISGHNVVRDTVFKGNAKAYNTYSAITTTVSAVGSIACGGWLAANKPRISAYNNIQDYDYTNTISDANHMNRPYNNSVLMQKQIIKYGKKTKDSGGFGYIFTAPGAVNKTTKMWRLGVNVAKRLVWHFGHGF